ncbi:vitamin K epoxide reductase family protein [Parapedobacter koreensis]|uniref:Protein-disulfide isomerase n=1 Tax=Parapedobacter koreensis TaxID=332977 RepID=A0A1H7ISU4_9SPHI|nr:vitamin K epoxide reductase family protein [Parapedobacter koreensis]SEK65561.1 Protein-disulfide isomerase [Parapedobacter koreensis]
MINLFKKSTISSEENINSVVLIYSQILELPISKEGLRKAIDEHPDYPSMLAVYDVFAKFGANVYAAQIDGDKLKEIKQPFIAQIESPNTFYEIFTVVKNLDDKKVCYYDPEKTLWIETETTSFLEIYKGVGLVVNGETVTPEADYENKRRSEKNNAIRAWASILSFPLLFIVIVLFYWIFQGAINYWFTLYSLLSFAGAIICCLLIWFEIDSHSPLLMRVCSGKRSNCNAILNSEASKVFGVSWSAIGFTFFTSQLLTFVFSSFDMDISWSMGWLGLLGTPYIVFSIYYQWRVARQWCPLCLSIQAVLALQAIIFIVAGGLATNPITALAANDIIIIVSIFLLVFLLAYWGVPTLRTAKEAGHFKNNFQRLKHNGEVFNSLLMRQKGFSGDIEGLGITLGKPDSQNKIIKVCSPYCDPCAKAHPSIDEILRLNPDVQVQIVFTSRNSERDYKAVPVKHFMAIASRNDEELTRSALHYWYTSPSKNYTEFASKYPVSDTDLQEQGKKLDEMWLWCNHAGILYTPTFFFNGQQLPDIYDIDDLKYMLT